MHPNRIFVTGTGTDIGKTYVSAILTEALHADYWKPVQAGYEGTTDSEWVRSMLSNPESIVHPELYKLKLAASPHLAAAEEGIEINIENIAKQVPASSRPLIIEGAGGLMVPLNGREFVPDLIRQLDVPVILVSRNMLGSINHSLLTAVACRQLNIKVLGWIFNDDYMDYANEIVQWTGVPMLAHIPFHQSPNATHIREQAEKLKLMMQQWKW
jgi:dethiobiotin synthetase